MSIHSSSVLSITRVNSTITNLCYLSLQSLCVGFRNIVTLDEINPESMSLEDLSEKANREKGILFNPYRDW